MVDIMDIITIVFCILYFLFNLCSCLHMTSDVQDIPEAYIHLIHTKQYYTLQ